MGELDPSVEWDKSLNSRLDLDQLCGDSFIQRATTGGRLYAVFRTDKSTFESNKGFDVDVEGGGWGLEVEAAVNKSVNHASESGSVNIDILQIGGSGTDWTRHTAPMNA